MIEFLSAEIFEITEWRLTGWLKYWHTGDYVLMIASVQHLSQNISAPTSSQPAQLPRYLTNEDNAGRHLTVIIATQFISRDEFFFWWLMVAGYEHCWLTFQMVHCWTRVLLDLNIFIEAWTVNMNTSNWVISRLRERLSVLAALTGRDGSLSQIYENSWSQLC